MPSNHGALVVIGSGPGIGVHVAGLFASKGFNKIILLSRDLKRLEDDASFVKSQAPAADVKLIALDVGADEAKVRGALAEVEKALGSTPLECLLYNAARKGPSAMLEFSAEGYMADLQISVVSLYIVAQWAIPQLLKLKDDADYKPTLLVTSGGLYKTPYPHMFSLASCKAAQYNLVNSMHKAYNMQGVHCALIVVAGIVKDSAKVTTPKHIAEETWKLFDQEKGKGDLDVEIKDPDYGH